MGNKESKEILEDQNLQQVKELAEKGDITKLEKYLNANLQRWKNEEVRFAITGRSASGKSTFINEFRGVTKKDETHAKTGRGNTTLQPNGYPYPLNPRVVLWDLPGVGTTKFKRETYVKDVDLENYDMFMIFMEHSLSEDDVWLAQTLTEMKKPFCFVRTKIDIDIKNAVHDDDIEKDEVISRIRKELLEELKKSYPDLEMEGKLFLICSRDTSIGNWNDLVDHIENSLPEAKFEAFVYSLPGITGSVIEKKKNALKTRINLVALGAAAVSSVPIPGLDIAVNMRTISNEVAHYAETFGLNKLEPSVQETLKCSEYLGKKSLLLILQASFPKYVALLAVETVADLILPVIGSIASAVSTAPIVHKMLNTILNMFVEDAYTIDAKIREQIK